MGKATIIENKEEGLYSVSIDRDTTLIEGLLDKIDSRLLEVADQIIEVQGQKAAKEAAKSANDDLLNIQIDLLTPENSAITNEIMRLLQIGLDLTSEIRDLTGKLALLEIEELSLEKRKDLLENSKDESEEDIRDVWCADYSLELTGEVPACEINGEPTAIILYPGSIEEEQPSIPADTGILTPIIGQSVAQSCFNFSVFPGWQKWKPIFRIGEITDIDYDADTCSVTLDLADSHYQGLNINQSQELEGVQIVYMTCNSAAFEINDRVLVQFVGQNFTTPRVIGFESEPKECCWQEPWDGPLLTSLWPWQHGWSGSGGLVIFPDNSTNSIVDGKLILTVGQTPSGGGWLTQRHQWYYYPDESFTTASKIKFIADARDACTESYRNTKQWMLVIKGKKDGVDIYFQIYVYNSSNYWGSGDRTGCLEDTTDHPEDNATDWKVTGIGDTWVKNIIHDYGEYIDLPVIDVDVDYVILDFKSSVDASPAPTYLLGGSMTVNHIEIC